MKKLLTLGLGFTLLLATVAGAKEHPGNAEIKKNGYRGPTSCDNGKCHKGVVKEFMGTVHWTHAGKAPQVENTDPNLEYGMKNRVYTMCNGNEIVNSLKEIVNDQGKVKYSGCDQCHVGDSINKPGSTGPAAEASVDCLLCHSSAYNFGKRKPFKDEKGRIALSQDRSTEAALAVGKPKVKNCMVCHEAAGGGVLYKRGFAFDAEHDAHAAKGMGCIDCHAAKKHRFPSGNDPNVWASDGLKVSCADAACHGSKPHKVEAYNDHVVFLACQTCHILGSGGSYIKDFTQWNKQANGFYEYIVLTKDPGELAPVYAWYNGTVANTNYFIGPKGSRKDGKSKIYPFKLFEGRAFFDKKSDKLMVMDFGPPMKSGDTAAGLASAAKILGIKEFEPVPGWQTQYFGMSHMVRKNGLTCDRCHAVNGILNFQALGYAESEVKKLTSPELYFEELAKQRKEDEW